MQRILQYARRSVRIGVAGEFYLPAPDYDDDDDMHVGSRDIQPNGSKLSESNERVRTW